MEGFRDGNWNLITIRVQGEFEYPRQVRKSGPSYQTDVYDDEGNVADERDALGFSALLQHYIVHDIYMDEFAHVSQKGIRDTERVRESSIVINSITVLFSFFCFWFSIFLFLSFPLRKNEVSRWLFTLPWKPRRALAVQWIARSNLTHNTFFITKRSEVQIQNEHGEE